MNLLSCVLDVLPCSRALCARMFACLHVCMLTDLRAWRAGVLMCSHAWHDYVLTSLAWSYAYVLTYLPAERACVSTCSGVCVLAYLHACELGQLTCWRAWLAGMVACLHAYVPVCLHFYLIIFLFAFYL